MLYEGKRWHIPVRWSRLKYTEICFEHLCMQQDVVYRGPRINPLRKFSNTLSDEQGARDGDLEWIKSSAT